MIIFPVNYSGWCEVFPVGWRRMKHFLLMIAMVALVGCGKKDPVQAAAEKFSNSKPGTVLWEFETGEAIMHSSPAIGSDGTVYVGSVDKKLYAINGKSGVKLWEFETGGPVGSSPAIGSDGTVYVGSYDNNLYAINPKTGVKLWEFETRGGVYSSPAIGSDGTVYVGSWDKKLYATNGKSTLPAQLQQAIETENYEEAARLRDQMKELEG